MTNLIIIVRRMAWALALVGSLLLGASLITTRPSASLALGAAAAGHLFPPTDGAVALSAGETTALDTALVESGGIAGVVTTASPVYYGDSISATAYDYDGSQWREHAVAAVAADGTYEIRGLASGIYRVGFASSHGWYVEQFFDHASDVGAATDVTVAEGSTTMNVDGHLLPAGHIVGVVRDNMGHLLDAITVTAYRAEAGSWQQVQQTYTQSGEYRLRGLEPGVAHRIRFSDDNSPSLWATEYYDNVPDIDRATDVVVTGGQITFINDAYLWTSPPSYCPPEADNVLANPGFEGGTAVWQSYFGDHSGYFTTGAPAYQCDQAAQIVVKGTSTNMQLFQTGFALQPNTSYRLTFAAYSSSGHDLAVYLHRHTSPYTNYGLRVDDVSLTEEWRTFSFPFTTPSDVSEPRLRFWFVNDAEAGDTYWIDHVRIVPLDTAVTSTPTASPTATPVPVATASPTATATASSCTADPRNALANGGFENGTTGWRSYFADKSATLTTGAPAAECEKAARIAVNVPSSNMQLYQSGFTLLPDTPYLLSFAAYTSSGHDFGVYLHRHTAPYTTYGVAAERVDLGSAWSTFDFYFQTPSDVTDPRLRFWFTNDASVGDVYWIDNVRLIPLNDAPPPTATNTPMPTGTPEPTATAEPGGCEADPFNVLLDNGFENAGYWRGYFADDSASWGRTSEPVVQCLWAGFVEIEKTAANMQLYQSGFSLQPNSDYVLSFYAASNGGHDLGVFLQKHSAPYTNYGVSEKRLDLPEGSEGWRFFAIPFHTGADTSDPRLRFWFAEDAVAGEVYYLDDVRIVPAASH